MDTYKYMSKSNLFIGVVLTCFLWLLYKSDLLLIWVTDEEYGHGLMVLGVLGYVIYHNRSSFPVSRDFFRWIGAIVTFAAFLMFLLGEVSGIAPIRMYSIWFFVIGLVLSIGGWELFKKLFVPLAIMFLLIPLPNVLGPMLTSQLQLISSNLGVWLIRSFGGIVFLEGNVIDMGTVKLMVAEACAGLRYLFPLMSIGAIAGYLMRAPNWIRWLLFLSTIPITIFMNSFRIAVTGLLSEAYGMSHTEGFLHYFEGWVVFLVSLLILIALAYAVTRFFLNKASLLSVFSFTLVQHVDSKTSISEVEDWQVNPSVVIMTCLLLITVISSTTLFERNKIELTRKSLSTFPEKLGIWQAKEKRLPVSIEVASGADEYYHGYFSEPYKKPVNLYISYYIDQKQGVAPHSPTLCIPGDGWVIESDRPFILNAFNGKKINVSRLQMRKGDKIAIAYYWIKQGEKTFYQQYVARFDLIRFTITENRSDAALIRLLTIVEKGETIGDADKRLQGMATELSKVISEYVPD